MNTKAKSFSIILPGLLLGALFQLVGGAQPSRDLTGDLETGATMLVTATATVDSIDLDKRELTLKGEGGHPVTLTVDQRVKRLNEIKPGDTVTANYYASAASEFRSPREDERAKPLVLLEETVKVVKEGDPAGVALRKYRVVATVEGVDRSSSALTLKGPQGKYHTVQVKDANKLADLRLGDSIVVEYTEAFAIAVTKTKAAETKD
jgi:hypothetical protein